MAFGVVLRLAWQFYFFLRTDLYFLAVTVLGCNDLQTVSRQLLLIGSTGCVGRRQKLVDEDTWTPRDRAVARWYCWLMVGGVRISYLLADDRHGASGHSHHQDRRPPVDRRPISPRRHRRRPFPHPQLQRVHDRRVPGSTQLSQPVQDTKSSVCRLDHRAPADRRSRSPIPHRRRPGPRRHRHPHHRHPN